MRRGDLKLSATLATALAPASLAAGQAAAQTPSAGPLDCVIEPRALIHVGSKVDGILSEVTVRKGMTTKVMPVEPVGGTYTATVTVVDKVFDAASGTFGVRLEVPNPDFKLPAGIKCTVDFGAR